MNAIAQAVTEDANAIRRRKLIGARVISLRVAEARRAGDSKRWLGRVQALRARLNLSWEMPADRTIAELKLIAAVFAIEACAGDVDLAADKLIVSKATLKNWIAAGERRL